jgi:hypothetical protein
MFWGFLYMGFPYNSNLSTLAASDFSVLAVSSVRWGRGEELDEGASGLFLEVVLSLAFLSQLTANMLDSTSTAASCMWASIAALLSLSNRQKSGSKALE